MADTPTADRTVVIEEDVFDAGRKDPVSGRTGARITTYRNLRTGRRWQVIGNCDRRGDCIVGAYIEGFGVIESKADIARARAVTGRERLESEMDTPVTPEFEGCCPFQYVELPEA